MGPDSIKFDAASRRIANEFTRMGVERRSTQTSEAPSFGEMLDDLVKNTDDMQKKADGEVHALISGKKDNVHEVMVAMSKADTSFKMMLEVRNKLLDAYTEVMRMQV
jgi:flagellar hook-basal body complex protein FliE